MSRFTGRSQFAAPLLPLEAEPEQIEGLNVDNGEGLPTPKLTKITARRMAGLREATEALGQLPAPGECLHVVCTARHDLTDTLAALMTRLGPVSDMRITTLGFNEKNIRSLLIWLDEGSVKRLTLVSSIFLRAHKRSLWEFSLKELRQRGQQAACCHSHAKVITLHFASGVKMAIEGSANLCGNGSGREQFALFNDAELHDWHAAWIQELADRHGTRDGSPG